MVKFEVSNCRSCGRHKVLCAVSQKNGKKVAACKACNEVVFQQKAQEDIERWLNKR